MLFAGEALRNQPRINESKRNDIIKRLIRLTNPDNPDVLRIEAFQVLTGVRKAFQFEDTWILKLLIDESSDIRNQA